jgi:transposase
MESHDVLRLALEKSNPKEVAAAMGVSLSLVYKWAQPDDKDGSGVPNPLDRIAQLFELTRDEHLIQWLS